jgi:sec-independent protein translocase protein TatA
MKGAATLVQRIFMSIGPVEIVIVLALALLVFGPQRLPQMGRTLGRAMREFRKASGDITGAFSLADDEEDEKQPREDAEAAATARDEVETAPRDEAEAAAQNEAEAAAQEPAAPAAGGPGAA